METKWNTTVAKWNGTGKCAWAASSLDMYSWVVSSWRQCHSLPQKMFFNRLGGPQVDNKVPEGANPEIWR